MGKNLAVTGVTASLKQGYNENGGRSNWKNGHILVLKNGAMEFIDIVPQRIEKVIN